MASIGSAIGRLTELPSAPTVVLRLHSLMQREDVGSHEIARVVETDAALVARILRLVNSPFYGFTRRVATIDEAIAILGSNSVHQLVLATSVFESLDGGRALDIRDFWWHSLGVGSCAKHLLAHADRDTRNEAMMCGLLHDVGHLVFAKMDSALFESLYMAQGGVVTIAEETKHYGVSHNQVGSMLADKWNFPEPISAAIAFHHSPDSSPEKFRLLVAAVHIGDILAQTLGVGRCATPFVSVFSSKAWDMLKIDENELERIMVSVVHEIQQLNDVFGN